MKKVCTIVLGLLLVSSAAFAKDIDAGRISLAGASSLSYNKMTLDAGASADATITTLTLNGAFYVMPNLGVGASVAYEKLSLENTDMSVMMLAPSVTYNFSLTEELSVVGTGSVGFAKAEVESESMKGWFINAGGGLRYFVNDMVAMDAGVTYTYAKLKDGEDIKITGPTIALGIVVFLK